MTQGNGDTAAGDQSWDVFLKEFGTELTAAEQGLQQLRDRYRQVTDALRERERLGTQIEVVRPERDRAKQQSQRQQLAAQLKQLEEKIAELDGALESRLFVESGLNEVFWQAVRFGGLGIAIGWLLERWIG